MSTSDRRLLMVRAPTRTVQRPGCRCYSEQRVPRLQGEEAPVCDKHGSVIDVHVTRSGAGV